MRLFGDSTPRCKRCHSDLTGDEEVCPHCGFNPRQMGLRVSMTLLLVFVLSMSVIVLTGPFWAGPALLLLGLAAVSFGLAVVTFAVSFVVTPSRFGTVFAWY